MYSNNAYIPLFFKSVYGRLFPKVITHSSLIPLCTKLSSHQEVKSILPHPLESGLALELTFPNKMCQKYCSEPRFLGIIPYPLGPSWDPAVCKSSSG